MIPMTLRFALKLGAGFKLTKASLTMPPAVKKRRTSDNYSQLHFYIHISDSDADAEFRRAHSLKGGTGTKSVLPLSLVCQTRMKKKHRQIKRLERSLVQIYKKEVILILASISKID
jgi:hypothetical protein